jgi:putative methionine-R-sulfoxide reductase with GAF domain
VSAPAPRDYSHLLRRTYEGDAAARMRQVVDAWWQAFGDAAMGGHVPGGGTSWVGFYLPEAAPEGEHPQTESLVLGPRRDKPACSPIGLHGACGRCYLSRAALVIADVAALGAGYIACDPRDRSELVLPLLDASGRCTGVLDVDSYALGAFTDHDAREAAKVLVRAGLSV